MAAGESDQDYHGSECREETGYQRYSTALPLRAPRLTEASGRLLLIVKGFGFGQARSGYLAPIFDRWDRSFLGVYLSKSLFDAWGRRSLTRFPRVFGLLDLGAGLFSAFRRNWLGHGPAQRITATWASNNLVGNLLRTLRTTG